MATTFHERLVLDESTESSLIYDEHLVRYQLAKEYARGKIVLDAACGSGYGAYLLGAAGASKVWAIDIDAAAVAAARARYFDERIEFLTDNVEGLNKIGDQTIDLAVSFETIEHLNDYQAFLRQLKRVLTPSGLAIISTPNREVFGQKNPFHTQEFSRQEFQAVLAEHFKNVLILEQTSGLGSVINSGAGTGQVIVNNQGQPWYFIALASDEPITKPTGDVASINPLALKHWQENKAWRLVNWLYSLFFKISKSK